MSANTAVIEELHQAIVEQRNMEELEGLLWAGGARIPESNILHAFRSGILLHGKT